MRAAREFDPRSADGRSPATHGRLGVVCRAAIRGPSRPISTQSPSQYSTPPSSDQHTNDQHWQSNQDNISTSPMWNRHEFYYWFTHRRDHDGSRWTHDRGSASTTFR